MAIVFPGTICPICSNPIDIEQGYFATTAFLDASDPLYKFSDVAIHWDCYLDWKYRREFALHYAKVLAREETNNPFWHSLILNDDIFVRYAEIGKIDILLVRLASHIQIKLSDFDQWLQDPQSENLYLAGELHRVREQIQYLKSIQNVNTLLADRADVIDAKKKAFSL